ncbi:methionyl-tRNA formyltransferase [Magnetospirillum aberrantis]|uniref:Methionyl-tRNA formyltransferase n=1 Tax=Magnetospirillum aberrantis SpK TaxID=908842 RepID=A0A7C9QR25_9PROT|nr:methionyl-tRNA formyltransferase [Magnetospirillum aberrantis]NFV78505.1 methionyl-tRNA formyltransferase [Magnetospirillum aberrantis SpK]
MRLCFMGTPDFSVSILAALIDAGHDVVCVYSQPPRPAGRGHKEQLTPVHAFAQSRGIAVRTPKSLKGADEQQAFRDLGLDMAVVAAYGLILPQAVLEAPKLGCLNVHASLLPRWRGAAPIQRAILAGDAETGVTIMQMDAGLDTGDMLLTQKVAITQQTTAGMLHDQLAETGARLIVEAVARYPELEHVKQPELGITYAAKLAKDEGRIDWTRPAVEIERQVRGLNPWPGVWCVLNEERLKVLAAEMTDGSGVPGTALDDCLAVACGEGALRLTRVQRAGKAPMAAADLLRGFAVPKGSRFG